MSFGERLLKYRNQIGLSQEKLAEKIGVTRQTISKWETDQSVPDFDKILPLCEVLNITTTELITGEKEEEKHQKESSQLEKDEYTKKRNKKKAIILSISIFLYVIATFSVPYMSETLKLEDTQVVMIWSILCTIATIIIIYFFIAYPNPKNKNDTSITQAIKNLIIEDIKNDIDDSSKENPKKSLITEIIAVLFLIIYLSVSFLTWAWHITWLIWIVFAFVELIVKLIFNIKEEKDKKTS